MPADPQVLTRCTHCQSPNIQLDLQHLVDAQRFGVLDQVPYMYRCWSCHKTCYSFIPPQVPDPDPVKKCATCDRILPFGRRRYCRDRCARPRKADLLRYERKRQREAEEG